MTGGKTNLKFLRIAALIAILIGAVGSLVLMFSAGRNQKSVILIALFTIWDVSPFAGLFAADMVSKSWSHAVRVSIYCLMFVLTAVSLVAYSGFLKPPNTANAFMFLVVPGASWLLIVTVLPVAGLISRKRSRN
jgi:hypothetical protein